MLKIICVADNRCKNKYVYTVRVKTEYICMCEHLVSAMCGLYQYMSVFVCLCIRS